MVGKSIPENEQGIHNSLQKIYDELLSLKNNRHKYINSKQILEIYDKFLTLIHQLSAGRKEKLEDEGVFVAELTETDTLVDDIWQLLSLCFVTCGLVRSAPATYASLSTVRKLLGHLKECQLYTMDDLKPIQQRLDEIKEIIDASENQSEDEEGDSEIAKPRKNEESFLLNEKLKECEESLKELKVSFEQIPKDLEPTYRDLLSIRKAVLGYLTASSEGDNSLNEKDLQVHLAEVKEKLKKIEALRNEEGKFESSDATESQLKTTQIVFNGLIDDCSNFIHDISLQKDTHLVADLFEEMKISDANETDEVKNAIKGFENIYANLIDIKQKLENLLITRRWTMRETDLYAYQKLLKDIETQRTSLNQTITKLKESPQNLRNVKRLQLLILYLLRRCYALIYKLLESSEPVLESLQPIHNQLSTVRRCLLEIKRVDGFNTLRDIYPFQFKLASLDNLRQDGKFIVNGQIPVGQGTLNALLSECFDILHELKIELEEKEDAAEESDDNKSSNSKPDYMTDTDDMNSDDEVEKKRKRYVGFNEADYDQASDSSFCDSAYDVSGYESNDYY